MSHPIYRFRTSAPRRDQILVATDDPDLRRLIADEAERASCDIVLAADGSDALDWLSLGAILPRALRFAIFDAALPAYPALALASCIRANHIDVPVVLIGAPAASLPASTLLRLGVVAVLAKPLQRTRLRDLLSSCRAPLAPLVTAPNRLAVAG